MGIKGFHKLTNPTNTSLQQLIKEVLKLDDTGKFMGIKPSPYSSCSCPNGCILCRHCGALYLLVYTLSKIGNENMSDVVNVLPEPINYALKAPILVEHIWPILVSEENRKKNAYKSERRRKSSNGQVTINIEDSHVIFVLLISFSLEMSKKKNSFLVCCVSPLEILNSIHV